MTKFTSGALAKNQQGGKASTRQAAAHENASGIPKNDDWAGSISERQIVVDARSGMSRFIRNPSQESSDGGDMPAHVTYLRQTASRLVDPNVDDSRVNASLVDAIVSDLRSDLLLKDNPVLKGQLQRTESLLRNAQVLAIVNSICEEQR